MTTLSAKNRLGPDMSSDTSTGTFPDTATPTRPDIQSVNPDAPEALELRAVELARSGIPAPALSVRLYRWDTGSFTFKFVRPVPYEQFSEPWLAGALGGGKWKCELWASDRRARGMLRTVTLEIDDAEAPKHTHAPAWTPPPAAPSPTAAPMDMQTMMLAMMQQQASVMSALIQAQATKPDATAPIIQTLLTTFGPAMIQLFSRRASSVGELRELLEVMGDRPAPAESPDSGIGALVSKYAPAVLEAIAAAKAQAQPESPALMRAPSPTLPAALPASSNTTLAREAASAPEQQTPGGVPTSAAGGPTEPTAPTTSALPPEYAPLEELADFAVPVLIGAALMQIDQQGPADAIIERAAELGIESGHLDTMKPGQLVKLLIAIRPALTPHRGYVADVDGAIVTTLAEQRAKREREAQQLRMFDASQQAQAAAAAVATETEPTHKAAPKGVKGKKS